MGDALQAEACSADRRVEGWGWGGGGGGGGGGGRGKGEVVGYWTQLLIPMCTGKLLSRKFEEKQAPVEVVTDRSMLPT